MHDDVEEIPKAGWTCKSITDLGKGKEKHLLCQNKDCNVKIRYVHTMVHKKYEGELMVGSTCAISMDGNAKKREINYKIRNKLKGWITPMVGDSDYKIMKRHGDSLIVWKEKIGEHSGKYSYNVSGPSSHWFDTLEEAQKAAINEKWPLFLIGEE
jgi:hypothetical protein